MPPLPPTSTLFPYTTLFRSTCDSAACHAVRWRGGHPARARSRGSRVRGPANREPDRKSTRLNSSHPSISYAVFCLKKKKAVSDVLQTVQVVYPLSSYGLCLG